MRTHDKLAKKMLKNPAVEAAYDAQAEEFDLLDERLKARHRAGLTQVDVAGPRKKRHRSLSTSTDPVE